jgi:hypothetical protein
VELYAGNQKSARILLNAPDKHPGNQAPVEFIEKGDLKPLESLAETMCAREHIQEFHDQRLLYLRVNVHAYSTTVPFFLARSMEVHHLFVGGH